jgi:hypothetical protein
MRQFQIARILIAKPVPTFAEYAQARRPDGPAGISAKVNR